MTEETGLNLLARKPRGRPPGSKNRPKNVVPEPLTSPVNDVAGGVTIAWLSRHFGMEMSSVRKRLAACPALAKRTSGYVYSLPVAAAYLVNPRIDVAKYLEGLQPKDLPVAIQQSYWDAQLKRQKWEREAGHLWATEDVIDCLSEVFKIIRYSMMLWPDTLERMTGLSEEQREILTREADNLQQEIYLAMKRFAAERSTPSALSRLDDLPSSGPFPEGDEPDLAELVL